MRTSRIFWSLLLLFLSLTAAARAQGDRDSLAAATTDPLTVQTAGGNSLAAVEQVWDAANTAYINSDYHRAIDAYRQLILRGYASDKLYYNLANAYFKVGRYGKAILYYNRALRLAPGDADIRFKQAYVNAKEEDVTIIHSPVGMPGRALKNAFIESAREGKKKPFKCVFHCIKTCDPTTTPYCISSALINAMKGNLDKGFVFCGANVAKVTGIVSVHELMETLRREYEDFLTGETSSPAMA